MLCLATKERASMFPIFALVADLFAFIPHVFAVVAGVAGLFAVNVDLFSATVDTLFRPKDLSLLLIQIGPPLIIFGTAASFR